MSTTIRDGKQLDALAAMMDREAIGDLLHRFGVVLDEQRFGDLRSVFATNASIATPGGRAEGIDAIVAQASRNHTPELRTQHLLTDLVVDVDGDRAHARANYLGVFATGDGALAPAPHFQIGSVYNYELVRTSDGWRVHSMEMRPTWAIGERP